MTGYLLYASIGQKTPLSALTPTVSAAAHSTVAHRALIIGVTFGW